MLCKTGFIIDFLLIGTTIFYTLSFPFHSILFHDKGPMDQNHVYENNIKKYKQLTKLASQ